MDLSNSKPLKHHVFYKYLDMCLMSFLATTLCVHSILWAMICDSNVSIMGGLYNYLVGNKPYLAPRGILSRVGPTASYSCHSAQCWSFFPFSFSFSCITKCMHCQRNYIMNTRSRGGAFLVIIMKSRTHAT